MSDDATDLAALKSVVKLLDAQRRVLGEMKADPEVIRVLGSVTRHLFNLSDVQALKLIHGSRHGSVLASRRLADAPKMTSLAIDEVEKLASDEKTSRSVLESIAVGRFQVPRGSLRSLGNLEQLRDKILTMARNERAHAAIAEVAKDGRS